MPPRAEILPVDLPEALRFARAEPRMTTSLAARLTAPSGETMPALLCDLSPSGALLVVDRRFSPLLPPPPGSSLRIEFYLDEIPVVDAPIVVRVTKERGAFLLEVGCSFVDLGDRARTGIRSKVAAAKITRRP